MPPSISILILVLVFGRVQQGVCALVDSATYKISYAGGAYAGRPEQQCQGSFLSYNSQGSGEDVVLVSQRIGALLVPGVWQVRAKGPQIIALKAVSIPGCCPPKIGYSSKCSSTTLKLNRGVDLNTLWRLSPVNGTADTYKIIPDQLSGCASVSYLLGIEPKTAGSTLSSSCRHSVSLVQDGSKTAKDRKKKPTQPPAKMIWKFTRVAAAPPSPSPKRPPSRPSLPPTVLEKTRVVSVAFITQPNGQSCSALSQEELKNITQTLCIQQMNYTLSQGWPRNQTTCVGTARCGGARQSNGIGASEHTTDLSLIHSPAQNQTAAGVATSLTEAMDKPRTFYGTDFPPNTAIKLSSIIIPPGGEPSSPTLSPSPPSPSPSPIPAPITVPSPTPTPTPTPSGGGSPPITPPGVPTAAVFTVNTGAVGAVDAAWTAPVSTGGATVTYDIQCTINTGASPPLITGISTTTYAITGLTPGATYACSVRSTNSAGSSAYSTAVTGLVIPPTFPNAPTSVVLTSNTGTSGTINVAWTAAFDGGAAVASYDIVCTLNVVPPSSTTFTGAAFVCVESACITTTGLTGLAAGSSYACTVRAVNSVGPSSYSTASSPYVIATTPAPPTNAFFDSYTDEPIISLGWTAPASNGDSIINAYNILCTPSPSGSQVSASNVVFSCNNADCIGKIGGVAISVDYTCQIAAVNAAGYQSLYSGPSDSFMVCPCP